MDEQSQEELRFYSILQELEKSKYHEDELKDIFGFSLDVRKIRKPAER